MLILSIHEALEWVQITSGGRSYTCPMKEIDGEMFFRFKNEWHQVAKFVSEWTTTHRL